MNRKIVIIGCGRVGSKIAKKLFKYFNDITVIDRDTIEKSNIEDGYLFKIEDIGRPKAIVVKEKLEIKNCIVDDLSSENINLIKKSDLIIDGTDNFETRFIVNDFCVKNKIPYIFGSVIKNKGMAFPVLPNGPCLRCIFDRPKNFQFCETLGVELDVVEAVTDKQLEIVLKILNRKEILPKLSCFTDKTEKIIKINKKLNCKCCAENNFEFLNSVPKTKIVKFCGSENYMVKGEFDFDLLKIRLRDRIDDYGSAFKYENMMIYRNKIMLKADSISKAKNLYLKLLNGD